MERRFYFTGTNNLNLGTGTVTPNASRQVTANGGTLTVGGIIGGGAVNLTKAGRRYAYLDRRQHFYRFDNFQRRIY